MGMTKQELHIEFAKAALSAAVQRNLYANLGHDVMAKESWKIALAMVAAMPPEAKEEAVVDAGYTATDANGLLSMVTGESIDGHDEIIVNGRRFKAVPVNAWHEAGEYWNFGNKDGELGYVRKAEVPKYGFSWSAYEGGFGYSESIEAAKAAVESALSKGTPNA